MSATLVQHVQGPLVRQPAPAAQLAGACISAAEALWDAATLDDAAQMWEDAKAAASWVLAATERTAVLRPKPAAIAPQGTATLATEVGASPVYLPGLQPAAQADPG